MQHLGPEVGQFHGLFVSDPRQDKGGRHRFRIGTKHAIHVRPDFDDAGADRRADDGGGVVRTVSTDGGRPSVAG